MRIFLMLFVSLALVGCDDELGEVRDFVQKTKEAYRPAPEPLPEIPEFNQLHAERKTNGLVVLGVNYDGLQGEKLAAVIERMDVRFPTLVVDPQVEYGFERAMTLPMTVLINPDREVHDILFGPQTVTSILAAQAASS